MNNDEREDTIAGLLDMKNTYKKVSDKYYSIYTDLVALGERVCPISGTPMDEYLGTLGPILDAAIEMNSEFDKMFRTINEYLYLLGYTE